MTINLYKISFSYLNGVEIYSDFSFELNGSIIALYGRSGCGKSTLMNLLVGYLKLGRGKIEFSENVTSAYYLPQDNALYGWMSGYENLLLHFSREKILKHSFFEKVKDYIFKKSYTYSFGQARKIEIFRMFLSKNDLVCLDEPFNYIDGETKEYIAELITSDSSKKTYIVSSHYKEDFKLLKIKNIHVFRDSFPVEFGIEEL